MAVSITIIFCGIWLLYNYATMFYDLPYIVLFKSLPSYVELTCNIVLRYTFPFGVFGVAFGIFGLVNRKLGGENHKVFSIFLMLFYIVLCTLTIF